MIIALIMWFYLVMAFGLASFIYNQDDEKDSVFSVVMGLLWPIVLPASIVNAILKVLS